MDASVKPRPLPNFSGGPDIAPRVLRPDKYEETIVPYDNEAEGINNEINQYLGSVEDGDEGFEKLLGSSQKIASKTKTELTK